MTVQLNWPPTGGGAPPKRAPAKGVFYGPLPLNNPKGGVKRPPNLMKLKDAASARKPRPVFGNFARASR